MSVSATRGRLSPITEISHAGGFCYMAPTPDDAPSGNDLLRPAASCLRLFEDGMELGPTHANHDDINPRVVDAFLTGDVLCFSRARTIGSADQRPDLSPRLLPRR